MSLGAGAYDFGRWDFAQRVDAERLRAGVRDRAAYLKVKRILDVLAVVLVAPAALVIFLIAATAIAFSMGRPVVIAQDRVGLNGRVFRLFKLRTMRPQSEDPDCATVENDPRITSLGRFLRHSHLDEIPQLWNVLIGEMSLIGPRPEQAHLVEKYRNAISNYELRHIIRPGLSGYAQVYYGYASDVMETRHKLEYDLSYVQHFGAMLDLKILLKTLGVYFDPRYVR